MTSGEFRELLERLARAWSTQDTELGLSCFTEDAVYTEPPDTASFEDFVAVEGKSWQWHIGNYP